MQLKTIEEARVPLIRSSAISAMNIGVRMKIPPQLKPQVSRAMHNVLTSCASVNRIQLAIFGRDVIKRLPLRPTRSAMLPKNKVPAIAPKLTVHPIHDAWTEFIGPVGSNGFVSDVNSRNAGEVHPQAAPKDIGRRFTGRVNYHYFRTPEELLR